MPVSRIATRSARAAVSPARFGNTPGYSTGSRPANSGCWTSARNCTVIRRGERIPIVLLAHRHDDLVDQWVPQPRDLHPVSELGRVATLFANRRPLAPRRTPDTDHRISGRGIRRRSPAAREVAHRHLKRDRVDAKPVGRVHAHRVRHRGDVQLLERTEIAEVEDRPQIHVEPLQPLTGEHLTATAEVMDGL